MAEKEKKKKKSDSVNVNLPKARASLKRQGEMKQMKGNYEDMWKFIGTLVVILIIGFIFLGGINQRKTWEWFKNFGQNIGSFFSSWFDKGDIVTNEDGVYWDPNGASKSDDGNESEADQQSNEQSGTPSEKDNSQNQQETNNNSESGTIDTGPNTETSN